MPKLLCVRCPLYYHWSDYISTWHIENTPTLTYIYIYLLYCAEDGFCEYEQEITEHGTFIWNETPVGETDEQECQYGNDKGIPEGSKATRYCAPEGWMMYSGYACLPKATFILIQLAMVCIDHGKLGTNLKQAGGFKMVLT